MFVTGTHRAAALRQEGHVYRPDAEPDRLRQEGHIYPPNMASGNACFGPIYKNCPPNGGRERAPPADL